MVYLRNISVDTLHKGDTEDDDDDDYNNNNNNNNNNGELIIRSHCIKLTVSNSPEVLPAELVCLPHQNWFSCCVMWCGNWVKGGYAA